MKKEIKLARATQLKKERKISVEMKKKKKAERGDKKKSEPIIYEPAVFQSESGSIPAHGDGDWTNGADIVIEVAIGEFQTDNATHAWTIEIFTRFVTTFSVSNASGADSKFVAQLDALGRYQAPAASKGS